MGRPHKEKFVKHKILVFTAQEDCYIYKRPNTSVWQYFCSIPNEGEERATTKVKGSDDDIEVGKVLALQVARERYYTIKSKQRDGLLAKRIKGLFEYIELFLKEEQERIAPFNQLDKITADTFRGRVLHMKLLKKYFKNKNENIDNLNFDHLYNYPNWRKKTTCDLENPIPVKPPKTNNTISAEISSFRLFFDYLIRSKLLGRRPIFAKNTREKRRVLRRDCLTALQYNQCRPTLRAWVKRGPTPTQIYNRTIFYNTFLILTNSMLRPGELNKLTWGDLEEASALSKEQQKRAHIIRVRAETSKVGESRPVFSYTKEYFGRIREALGIAKQPKTPFPHVPDEWLHMPVFSRYGHPEIPMGKGLWDRGWKEIKNECMKYWGKKNVTWYSLRHTGISFACSNKVPMLTLSRVCGTGVKYIEDVYYHHEAESRETFEILTQNRKFTERVDKLKDDKVVAGIDTLLEDIDVLGEYQVKKEKSSQRKKLVEKKIVEHKRRGK